MAGRRITIEFLGKDVSAGRTAQQVDGKFSKLRGKLDKVGAAAGKILVGGVLAGGAAMVKFGNQASDLAETQSKVAQIFGKDSVDALEKFAGGAAKSMGQSRQTALDAAATFGIIGKGAGLAGDDLVKFSTKMTGLASDMASFNNTSPEEAIEAIGAAMRGESEPIRKYGVLLDDATLRAQAMKMGLIKTTKEALTPQQKALAAQAVILRQTKDQQGDFARTSDGLANKQRILKAQFENLTTQLGAKALPVMLKVTDWGLGAIKWMGKHKVLIGTLVGVIGGFVTAVWAINAAARAYTAVQAALNIVLTANPIGIVVVAAAALAAGLIIAYKKSETFRKVIDGAFRAVANAGKWMWNSVLKPTFNWLTKAWMTVAASILHGAALAFGWVPGIGPKLRAADEKFRDFRERVNRQINGIKNPKIKVTTPGADTAIGNLATINRLIRDIKSAGPVRQPANSLGGLLAPGRARGGPMSPSRPHPVGESGFEIFKPYQSGRMIPNGQSSRMLAGGGGGVVINFNGMVTDPKAAAREVRKILVDLKRSNGGRDLGIA